ncbi:MAG: carbohydrate ABC transporter permease [Chloroflexi bacterium]|nr:carbohydrate ABC transporter permease [Chloroflexota bacterium]
MRAFHSARRVGVARQVTFYASLVLVLAFFLFPFFWMIINSFKTNERIQEYPPAWAFAPTTGNFQDVFRQTPFLRHAGNSLIVALGSVGLGLALGLPAAYGIARYRFHRVGVAILACRMIPGVSFLLPWFIVFRSLGLLDTYTGLVIAHLIITVPLITWIMLSFFEEVPVELEEAARIDGCSPWGAFFRVALPLVRSGVAAAAILALIFCWNHFLLPLILAGPRTKTLPVVVYSFMAFDELNLGGVYASATLITMPVLAMTLLVQRHFVRGLLIGGVKG